MSDTKSRISLFHSIGQPFSEMHCGSLCAQPFFRWPAFFTGNTVVSFAVPCVYPNREETGLTWNLARRNLNMADFDYWFE